MIHCCHARDNDTIGFVKSKQTLGIINFSMTMQLDEHIRTDYYHVGWQDVDPEGRITLKAISQMLQDSAWKHAGQLGFGFDFMQTHQAIWVMFRLHIHIVQYPGWDQKIGVTTWTRGLKGAFALRDFEVHNQQDELLISATSEWLVLGMDDRKPKKTDLLNKFLPYALPNRKSLALTVAFNMNNELAMLGKHKVTYAELDLNQHVNTSYYIDWIMNHIPRSLPPNQVIEHFSITFLSECKLDQEIMLKGSFTEQPYAINGIRTQDNKTVFAAAFHTRKAEGQ